MKRIVRYLLTVIFVSGWLALNGKEISGFYENFSDSTLRIDYIFGGGPQGVRILLEGQTKQKGWAGRKSRLTETPLKGNATILVKSPFTGDTLYTNSFSTLFQEWINTPEAGVSSISFENSLLVPLPLNEAAITVSLRDNQHKEIGRLTHRYRPDDILVREVGQNPLPHKFIHKGKTEGETIDIAILAEGYTEREMDKFLDNATKISNEILSYEPFASNKEKFSFIAVMSPSEESGVSVPKRGEWKNTAFDSHYSTFYSDRYLTTPRVWKLHKALEGIPYEHILIIVNTPEYGGGGIFNCYQIAAADNEYTLPVSVHEFGHSFGGLADEYFYIDEPDDTYVTDVEPWEGNITTLVDFNSKWADLLEADTPVPTPWDNNSGSPSVNYNKTGVYEGGGYKQFGVFRPVITCRMRDNHYPTFCPVCERILTDVINFYTE